MFHSLRRFFQVLALFTGVLAHAEDNASAPLWKTSFASEGLQPWVVAKHGGAKAEAAIEGQAVKLSSHSSIAPNVWLSLTARDSVPAAPGGELVLRFRAAGEKTGRAFAALAFKPAGGQSRLYLPQGDFRWQTFDHAFQVPAEARSVQVFFGVESNTEALRIDDISIIPPATPRADLSASWIPRPHERIFPQAGSPAETLLALDLSKLNGDERMLATTLQGIINRKQPRVYLFHNPRDRFWADWLVESRYIKTIREVPDLPKLLAEFQDEVSGCIVYDPALPASRNAAVMLGAIEGKPATGRATAEALGLAVTTDLRGRWKRNVDAYRELWTKHRDQFASHVLAVHYPAMENQGPRDYLAQQRIFTFWVSGYGDNEAGADPAAELNFAHEVLAATPPNIPIMGWWSYGNDNKGIPEYDAVRLSSSYAKYLAGSEYCTNLSVLSGIRVPSEVFRQPAYAKSSQLQPGEARLYTALSVMDSGDSQWYWQHYQPKFWTDPARGRVPINWSLNPTVADVMPPVLAWYYQRETPKDLLFCAISGLGYMNPRLYASRFRAKDRERIWSDYISELSSYMNKLDLHILGIYAGSFGESRGTMHEIYARFIRGIPALEGILSDFGRHDETNARNALELVEGKPVFHTMMRWLQWTQQGELGSQLGREQQSVDFTLRELLDHAPPERPALMSGLILSWTMSPTLVERVASHLPEDVQLISARDLMARAQKGQ